MKKIAAIIAPTEFEAVRDGLRAAGILADLAITPACGLQRSSTFSPLGAALNRDLIRTLKIEVIVSDRMARKAVNAIFDYICSGKNGPAVGQITVLEIETTLPIGTEL
jgi:nitrogen regulatory protein PII